MDGGELGTFDRPTLIDRLANDVHDTTEGRIANRDLDGRAGVHNFLATNETFGTVHGNGSDTVLAKMGGNLEHKAATLEVLNLESIEDGWEILSVELNINDRTNDGLDGANISLSFGRIRTNCGISRTFFAMKI
jgi:hypothetical protein